MFSSYWNRRRILLAVAGAFVVSIAIAWMAYSIAQYKRNNITQLQGSRASYYKNFDNVIFEKCLSVSGQLDRIACVTRETRAQERQAYAYHNLEAQQDMAVWTYALLLVSVAGTVIAFAGVVYVAGTLKETQRANKIAHDQLLASQRPWVSIQPRIVSDLVFKDGEGRVTIQFLLHNHGSSPAIGARVEAKILPEPFEAWRELEEIHESALTRPPKKMIGHNIFPGNSFIYNISIPIEKARIEQFRDKVGHPDLNMITGELAACATYFSPIEQKVCMTDLVIWISRKDPERPNATLALITDDGVTKMSDLELRPTIGSGQAH